MRKDERLDRVFWVRSKSTEGKEYRVLFAEGYTECTCAHGMNNPGRARCWHVREAEQLE